MPSKIFIAICLLFIATAALAEEITLMWDIPADSQLDGFRCYQKTAYANDAYNYSNPVKTPIYPSGDIPADVDTLRVNVLGEEGGILKYLWVCRSYKGNEQSSDSNEVAYKVINTAPPVPINLNGRYDDAEKMIYLAWDQPLDNHIIYKWVVYYRIEGDSDYTEIAMVNYDQDPKIQAPFDVVLSGEKKTVYFTVVSFRRSGVYSENSAEYAIDIDRQKIPPIENLRISIDIPIE